MKDAITYANEAGFFEFNVVGWRTEFERLIQAVRDDALAEPTVKESLTVQFSDHIADAGKVIMLTAGAAQQIDESLLRVEQSAEECEGDDGMVMVVPLDLYNELAESLETIRAARAQADHIAGADKMVREPVTIAPFHNCKYKVCDLPGQCIGEGKCHHPNKLIASPIEPVNQEPVAYLDNGTRFKVTLTDNDCCISGLPQELGGRWVALVDATDGKHLKAAPVEPVKQEPIGYQYLFSSPFGGDVWRDSSSQWNGNKPKASRAIYAAQVRTLDTSPERVEKTAESIRISQPHRYAGSFGD